jgi:hypothetical protein
MRDWVRRTTCPWMFTSTPGVPTRPAATSLREIAVVALLEDCRPSAAASMTAAALSSAISVSSRPIAAGLLQSMDLTCGQIATAPSIGPTDPGRVPAHRMQPEGVRWKRSTCPRSIVEVLATSRHRRDNVEIKTPTRFAVKQHFC